MDSFADSYAQARHKFVSAAEDLGLSLHTCVNPHLGPQGEELATDMVVLGNPTAKRALYVTSGVHGVEGYFGSGIMVQWLRDELVIPESIKLVLVHACNPYGFAHGRRFTEENVDLNRNFFAAGYDFPHRQAYEEVQDLVEYASLAPDVVQATQAKRQLFLDQHGHEGMKIALSEGQHQSPDGLFYAGRKATWARLTFEAMLERELSGCERVFYLDLHTGLGPEGYADFLTNETPDSPNMALLERFIGPRALGLERDAATSQIIAHTTKSALDRHAQQHGYQLLAGTIECGTWPLPDLLEALVQESALTRHGCDDAAQAANIKQNLKDGFYVNTNTWKRQVYEQTCEVMTGALAYLKDNLDLNTDTVAQRTGDAQ